MLEDLKNHLADGVDLTAEEMQYFLDAAIGGDLTEARKIEVLSLINSKGVTGQELAFAVQALAKPREAEECIDVCGTGGSGLSRINVSTLSAFLLASIGVPVAKHGNRAASGRCGSFDLLELLGVRIDLTPEQSEQVFREVGLGFFFAPQCYPQMGAFGLARKSMGVPTMFNLLGPLLSPLNPKRQLIGAASHENAQRILEACRRIGRESVYVVVGTDGLDEVSLAGTSTVYRLDGEPFTVTPESFGLQAVDYEQIAGGDAEQNQFIAINILSGAEIDSPRTSLVCANAALALQLVGHEPDLEQGTRLAREVIRNGRAMGLLEEEKVATRRVSQ